MTLSTIQPAQLTWNEQGTPVAQQFDDVYFSNDDGLAESDYVFLQGNRIGQRLAQAGRHKPFVIVETGFGSGLNFLLTWQLWQTLATEQKLSLPCLHFISIEKHPLTLAALQQIHQLWPALQAYSQPLQQQWPAAIAGCHRLFFAQQRVMLDLYFADVADCLPLSIAQIENNGTISSPPYIDAWYLDGFSPAKNRAMWQDKLFQAMAINSGPQTTFATFTAAGFVRRGLQQAGFIVQKRKGFGHKREMLIGQARQADLPPANHTNLAPTYHPAAASNTDDIAIIGGGIASILTALALLRRGAQVSLYCADPQLAMGASGNPQGAVYPLLTTHDPLINHFYAQAFLYARQRYDSYLSQGAVFEHQWCGVSQVAYNDKMQAKLAKLLTAGWPTELVYGATAAQLSQAAGLTLPANGVIYPQAGWVSAVQLVNGLAQLAQQQGLQIHYQHQLNQLTHHAGQWQLNFNHQPDRQHATVILANGHRINQWMQTGQLPVSAARGQVSLLTRNVTTSQIKQVICFSGYLTPRQTAHPQHCLGASYRRDETSLAYRHDEQQENAQRLASCFSQSAWLPDIIAQLGEQARVSIRCITRDHLPMVGAVPNYSQIAQFDSLTQAMAAHYPNLYMIGALGARGLTSAPLTAELLAAQIFAESLPLSANLLTALNPNRFWMRKLIKGKML